MYLSRLFIKIFKIYFWYYVIFKRFKYLGINIRFYNVGNFIKKREREGEVWRKGEIWKYRKIVGFF